MSNRQLLPDIDLKIPVQQEQILDNTVICICTATKKIKLLLLPSSSALSPQYSLQRLGSNNDPTPIFFPCSWASTWRHKQRSHKCIQLCWAHGGWRSICPRWPLFAVQTVSTHMQTLMQHAGSEQSITTVRSCTKLQSQPAVWVVLELGASAAEAEEGFEQMQTSHAVRTRFPSKLWQTTMND